MECKNSKMHHDIGIVLFIMGMIIAGFVAIINIAALYIYDPILLYIAAWLYATGMTVILFIIGIILLVAGAWMHIASARNLAACNFK